VQDALVPRRSPEGALLTRFTPIAAFVSLELMAREAMNATPRTSSRPRNSGQAEIIESRDNRWLKIFRAALRRGYLPDEGLIGLEGPHLVEEALRSGLDIEAILLGPDGEKTLAAWPDQLRHDARILKTTARLFEGVAGTEHPQGIAALVRPREWTFDDLVRDGAPLVIVLVGVQDPGNVGTAVRSAGAFGATGLVATKGTADPWSSKALRASAGSALRLPILRGIAPAVSMAQLRVAGLRIFAASAKQSGSASEPPADLRDACAIFIGNEGAGLPPDVERSADGLFAIPMASGVDSLNAGVAASIILYEAARQRSENGGENRTERTADRITGKG
jgi:TrmH family RNA methyltransferase